jgi:hypothetical protein
VAQLSILLFNPAFMQQLKEQLHHLILQGAKNVRMGTIMGGARGMPLYSIEYP